MKELKEESLIFAYDSKGLAFIMVRKTWHADRSRMLVMFLSTDRKQRTIRRYKSSKPAPPAVMHCPTMSASPNGFISVQIRVPMVDIYHSNH